jgi:SAM-dependent methyltransferase
VTPSFFADPQLAEIYDALHTDRRDLDPYLAVVDELGATSVLDLGCGTGTFACELARRGRHVVGVDPAAASIDVARRKAGADGVRWIVGDSAALGELELEVDMVTMTGNVGEHLSDAEWLSTLTACRAVLRPGGHLVFGARDPVGEPWLKWNAESTFERSGVPGVGAVRHWLEITDAGLRHFSFRWTFVFERDGASFDWNATFRVRTRDELVSALHAAEFDVVDVREDEFMFIARVADKPSERS